MSTDFLSSFNQDTFLKSQKVIQALCNTLAVGIQVLKPVSNSSGVIVDFEYIMVNEVFTDFTGTKDPARKTFLSIYPDQSAVFNQLLKTINNEMPANTIHSFAREGTTGWLENRYVPFAGGVMILTKDISEQFKVSEEIRELNLSLAFKNRQLETLNSELHTFTNIAANDYKETLRNLYTGLEYIASQEAVNLTDTGKANVRRAQASIQKMKLLTEDIITYSAIPSGEKNFSPVDMNLVLEAVKNDLTGRIGDKNVNIECDELPVLHGYPVLLSLLFHHLVDNSAKFKKEATGLVIHIRCSEEYGNNIPHPASQPDTKYQVISVIDNGNGFDPKHAMDIFTIFYRIPEKARQRGSGIGLAVCKKIMDLHGGFIWAESTPANGATFHCCFPMEEK